MFTYIRHAARLAAVSLLAASIVAPAAGAGRYSLAAPSHPAVVQPIATCHQYCGAVPTGTAQAPTSRAVVRTELVRSSGAGFHWADAALGFGLAVACGAIGMILLSVFPGRRTRVRHAGSTS